MRSSVLGLELGAERLILDEQPARRLATSLGLRVIGTVGLLLAAKDRGFLTKIKPGLDRLLAVRFFMDRKSTIGLSARLESD
jgi:uncharacterized protein